MVRGRHAAIAVLSVVCLAVGMRIWWVNTNLPRIPEETYETGEWVPLEGAFQDSTSSEDTSDYSIKVVSAEVMTRNEYLEKCGGTTLDDRDGARCVVDVTLVIRNDGTERGGLNVFQMVLTPARGNEYLICDVMNEEALWPQVESGADTTVSIKPGTEYEVHIPYVFNGGEEVYEREVNDRDFTLLLSRMPVRKMVNVSAR